MEEQRHNGEVELRMKAVLKTQEGPGIEVRDVDVPQIGDTDILVKVVVSSVCGSDVSIYEWKSGYQGYHWWDGSLSLPVILGHEFSGRVVEVGSRVYKAAVGDRITASPLMPCGRCDMCLAERPEFCMKSIVGMLSNGTYAEYVRLTAEANIIKLPDNVSYEAASLIEPLAVALHAVELSSIKPGDRAAVIGPGPIGLMSLQVLKAAGASLLTVSGTSADRKRLEMAERLGADIIIDVEKEDVVTRVMAATEGEGLDFVFEATGNSATLPQALSMVGVGGKVVLIGMYSSPAQFNPVEVVIGNKSIIGSFAYESQTWKRSLALLAKGIVAPEAMITHRLPLEEAEKGFEMAAKKEAVKVVLIP